MKKPYLSKQTIYSIIITVIALIFINATIQLLETTTITNQSNNTTTPLQITDEQLRNHLLTLNEKQINGVLITIANTLTEIEKEKTLPQFEKEHTAHANRLAIEHMNTVLGVLIKSIGAFPDSNITTTTPNDTPTTQN